MRGRLIIASTKSGGTDEENRPLPPLIVDLRINDSVETVPIGLTTQTVAGIQHGWLNERVPISRNDWLGQEYAVMRVRGEWELFEIVTFAPSFRDGRERASMYDLILRGKKDPDILQAILQAVEPIKGG